MKHKNIKLTMNTFISPQLHYVPPQFTRLSCVCFYVCVCVRAHMHVCMCAYVCVCVCAYHMCA